MRYRLKKAWGAVLCFFGIHRLPIYSGGWSVCVRCGLITGEPW